MLERVWRKGNPLRLLVGMQTSTATMENSVEIPWKTGNRTAFGEGNGNPLQCSCLENPRDGGAWWAAIYGVAQSRPWLKRLSSSSSSSSGSFALAASSDGNVLPLDSFWFPSITSFMSLFSVNFSGRPFSRTLKSHFKKGIKNRLLVKV